MTKLKLAMFVILISLVFPLQSREQATKFYGNAAFVLVKACGRGLDANSACGSCVRVEGAAVTKAASCGHVCVKLPDNLKPENVIVVASGGEGDNTITAAYKKCGAPYAPCVGFDRYEGTEWYADTHMICGRFKNWSNNRSRSYSIQVYEK